MKNKYYTAEQRDEYILVHMPGNDYHLELDFARKLRDSLDVALGESDPRNNEMEALFKAVMKEIREEAEGALGHKQMCSAPQAVRRLAYQYVELKKKCEEYHIDPAPIVRETGKEKRDGGR